MKLNSNEWYLRCDSVEQKNELFALAAEAGLPIDAEAVASSKLLEPIIGVGFLSGQLTILSYMTRDEGHEIDEVEFRGLCAAHPAPTATPAAGEAGV